MKDKIFLNKDLKAMFISTRDKKVRYGMNKILKYFRIRLSEAEDIEREIIEIDSELRNLRLNKIKNKSID